MRRPLVFIAAGDNLATLTPVRPPQHRRETNREDPEAGAPPLRSVRDIHAAAAAGPRHRPRSATTPTVPDLGEHRPDLLLPCARSHKTLARSRRPGTVLRRAPWPPSRPRRRGAFSQPRTACPSPPVDYTCHGGAPRPNTGPNKPPECRIAQRRRSPAAENAAGEQRRHPAPLTARSALDAQD